MLPERALGATAAVAMVILSQVSYQLAQKALPGSVKPFAGLAVVYGIAMGACLLIALLTGGVPSARDYRVYLSLPILLLSAAIIGIEAGFLLLYRGGGAVSTAYTTASAGTVAGLVLIGTIWLREPISAKQLLGLTFAALGGWLAIARH